jgi:hypothetical protein
VKQGVDEKFRNGKNGKQERQNEERLYCNLMKDLKLEMIKEKIRDLTENDDKERTDKTRMRRKEQRRQNIIGPNEQEKYKIKELGETRRKKEDNEGEKKKKKEEEKEKKKRGRRSALCFSKFGN